MSSKTSKLVSLDTWIKSCKEQHEYFKNQSTAGWSVYNSQDCSIVLQKIAISLFGKAMNDNDTLDLTDDQEKIVHEIRDKCVQHNIRSGQIKMAVIFVLVYVDEASQKILPVITVMSQSVETRESFPNNIFIDHLGRVYKNWTEYKAENTMNMSILCVPKDGYYSSKSSYEFLDQRSRGAVLNVIDRCSTFANIATGLTMVGGIVLTLIPPTAPIGASVIFGSMIAGAPGAVYGFGRSVEKLADRVSHEQSISLADSEARQCWLITASSLLSIGPMVASKMLAKSAEAGMVASKLTRLAVTTLNGTTTSLAGVGVINSIYELSRQDDVTSLDVLQLTTSIFFFSHSLVTFKTAINIINEAQKGYITRMKNNLSLEQQLIHDALLKGTKKVVEPGKVRYGRAQFIRHMKNIGNINEFYRHFQIKPDGQLFIDSELTIHPRAFLQIDEILNIFDFEIY